jgi:5-methylcytosine-specific restriction endonuclease McrA
MAPKLCLGLPGRSCANLTSRGPRCPDCTKAFGYTSEYEANKEFVLSKSKICWRCGLDGATTADHVIPRARGGSNAVLNLRPAHEHCNYAAGGALSRGGRGLE